MSNTGIAHKHVNRNELANSHSHAPSLTTGMKNSIIECRLAMWL
jgi:hypothetical protein